MQRQEPEPERDPANERPIWYLEGPFYRYTENVKKLANMRGLSIIDATVTTDRTGAAPEEDLPKVTLKPEYGGPKPTLAKTKA